MPFIYSLGSTVIAEVTWTHPVHIVTLRTPKLFGQYRMQTTSFADTTYRHTCTENGIVALLSGLLVQEIRFTNTRYHNTSTDNL